MEHREHFLCPLGFSERAALPMGHSLFTPQLLLRSIQHQPTNPFVPVLLLDTVQWASSCLYMEFVWICDSFFIENKSNFIKNVMQARAAIMKMAYWECSWYLQYQKIKEILGIDLSANRHRYNTRNSGLEKITFFTNIKHEQKRGNNKEQWKRLNS